MHSIMSLSISIASFVGLNFATTTCPPSSHDCVEQIATVSISDHPNSDSKWWSISLQFEGYPKALPVAAGSPVGIYLDVEYPGMVVAAAPLDTVSGVKPESPDNYVAYTAAGTATILEGQPAMTIVFSDSTFDYLALKSFYFGCVVGLENSEVALLTGCSVTIECIDSQQKSVAKQSFDFKLTGAAVQDMVQAKVCWQLSVISSGQETWQTYLVAERIYRLSNNQLQFDIRCSCGWLNAFGHNWLFSLH